MSDIILRQPGEYTPFETRSEAHETVDKETRYKQILEVLGDDEMTAKEIAVRMCARRYIPTTERNFTAPRLTELQANGKVEVIGKRKCAYTHKMVSVYKIRNNKKEV